MMGSRGYDMTPTMYSPDGRIYQVEYAIETVKRGAIAIGLQVKDGVILAVEEKSRDLQVEDITQKIFQVDDHIGIAAAGYIPDARIMVDSARFFSQSNKLTYDESVEIETVAKHLADQSHQFTQYSGVRPFGVALIIAGVDRKGTRVFVTDPSGTYIPYAAVAIGGNSDEVTDFLEKNYKNGMSMDDAMSLAITAINLKSDEKGVKNIRMSTIKTDTVLFEKVSNEELAKHMQTEGKKKHLSCLRPGSFLGEMALLTGEKRSADVISCTESLVGELTKDSIMSLATENPEILSQMTAVVAERRLKNKEKASENGKDHEEAIQNEKKSLMTRATNFFFGKKKISL